jgi:hypothetical protein
MQAVGRDIAAVPGGSMKDANDPTSQSEDETKFYREVEDMIEKNGGTMPEQEDAVKMKRIAYAIARVERLRRELEEAKHNLRVEQGYSQ